MTPPMRLPRPQMPNTKPAALSEPSRSHSAGTATSMIANADASSPGWRAVSTPGGGERSGEPAHGSRSGATRAKRW